MKRHPANLLTVLGILAGMVSIGLSVFTDQFSAAGALILVSALIDRYDGKLARYLGIETHLGRWLDSVNDFVSFGLAPVFLLGRFIPFANMSIFFILAAIYLLAGLFRLVRFNTQRTASSFTGLPITLAGVILTMTAFISDFLSVTARMQEYTLLPLMVVMSVLMIAGFRWRKI